jgi:hypothetical protein
VSGRYRTAYRIRVRTGRKVRTGKNRKNHRKHVHMLVGLDGTRQTGNRQTEKAGVNTQGIMRGDTWWGVETSTKTGETDQDVTLIYCIYCCTCPS